jgi:hypothetical protein
MPSGPFDGVRFNMARLSGKSWRNQTSITFAAPRKSERRWMRRDAQLIFEGHKQAICCVVHNISNDGARLSFIAPLALLPRTCTLVLFKDCV